jgi:hypothetical protein
MPDPTISDMNRRLIALERENRVLRRIGGTGLLLALAVCFVGQAGPKAEAVPDVLRARRVEVVDETGVRRVLLGPVDTGESPGYGLELSDGKGRGATTLGCRADGSQVLWMHDPAARALVRFEAGVSGDTSHLGLLDGEQRTRVRLRVKGGGAASVAVVGEDGTVEQELGPRK